MGSCLFFKKKYLFTERERAHKWGHRQRERRGENLKQPLLITVPNLGLDITTLRL